MYAVSWSGGKDSCLAMHIAQQEGFPMGFLLNTISAQYQRVRFHGVPRELIAAQAEALGLSLLQWPTGDDTYEADFLSALKELKARGAVGVIFGDMFPEGHREWGQRMCAAAGLQAHHPLFGWDTHKALKTFLAAGYKAVIVSGRPDMFRLAQMGTPLTEEFLQWAQQQPGLDVSGENGEYHTIVLDGPLFRQRVEIVEAAPACVQGHYFWDIRRWALQDKAAQKSSRCQGEI